MSPPLVSVVIATYNAGAYLRTAIASILAQTVPDLELIVIDDGSTDGTRQLVAEFPDSRVSYHWQSNAGQTSAKNHGISRARGTYVAFCDGDDHWLPNKLEVQLPLFRTAKVGVVYSAAHVIDQDDRYVGPYEGDTELFRGDVTEHLFMKNFVPFGTAVVRRECLDALGAFDASLKMGIDWELWLRISAHHEFDFVPESTYAYRIWPGQMSRNWRGRYSSAFRIMREFIERHPHKISRSLARRAMANTYANRARVRSVDQPWAAVGDGLRATALDPLDKWCWLSLARVFVDACKSRPTPEARDKGVA